MKNTKNYELTIIFDVSVDINKALDKVAKSIESVGGSISKLDNDGKKRLAYPIKGQDSGVYVYYELFLPDEKPGDLSRELNINDDILRHLLVRIFDIKK